MNILTFVSREVMEGYIYVAVMEDGVVDVYTRRKGYGNLIHQFGIECTVDEAIDIAMGNYENDNLIWQDDIDYLSRN